METQKKNGNATTGKTTLNSLKLRLLGELDAVEQALSVSDKLKEYGIKFTITGATGANIVPAVTEEADGGSKASPTTNLSIDSLIMDALKQDEEKAISATQIGKHVMKFTTEQLPQTGKDSIQYHLNKMHKQGIIKRIKYTGSNKVYYQMKYAGKAKVAGKKNITEGFKRPNFGLGATIKEVFADNAIAKPTTAKALLSKFKPKYKHLTEAALKHELYRHGLFGNITRVGKGEDAKYQSNKK